MEDQTFRIDAIYVPVKRRQTLDPDKVAALAESIIEEGLKIPIKVREDGRRWVLVEGLHRLEACRALGEETITGVVVHARRR
jgi:ParB-like chromosome segregation protein Spo0J